MGRLRLSSATSALSRVHFSSHATLNNQTIPVTFASSRHAFALLWVLEVEDLLLLTTVDIFLVALWLLMSFFDSCGRHELCNSYSYIFPCSSFFDCFSVVVHLTWVTVINGSERWYLDPTGVAVQHHEDDTSIWAFVRKFAVSPSTVWKA